MSNASSVNHAKNSSKFRNLTYILPDAKPLNSENMNTFKKQLNKKKIILLKLEKMHTNFRVIMKILKDSMDS
jgi:hypothetical protein